MAGENPDPLWPPHTMIPQLVEGVVAEVQTAATPEARQRALHAFVCTYNDELATAMVEDEALPVIIACVENDVPAPERVTALQALAAFAVSAQVMGVVECGLLARLAPVLEVGAEAEVVPALSIITQIAAKATTGIIDAGLAPLVAAAIMRLVHAPAVQERGQAALLSITRNGRRIEGFPLPAVCAAAASGLRGAPEDALIDAVSTFKLAAESREGREQVLKNGVLPEVFRILSTPARTAPVVCAFIAEMSSYEHRYAEQMVADGLYPALEHVLRSLDNGRLAALMKKHKGHRMYADICLVAGNLCCDSRETRGALLDSNILFDVARLIRYLPAMLSRQCDVVFLLEWAYFFEWRTDPATSDRALRLWQVFATTDLLPQLTTFLMSVDLRNTRTTLKETACFMRNASMAYAIVRRDALDVPVEGMRALLDFLEPLEATLRGFVENEMECVTQAIAWLSKVLARDGPPVAPSAPGAG